MKFRELDLQAGELYFFSLLGITVNYGLISLLSASNPIFSKLVYNWFWLLGTPMACSLLLSFIYQYFIPPNCRQSLEGKFLCLSIILQIFIGVVLWFNYSSLIFGYLPFSLVLCFLGTKLGKLLSKRHFTNWENQLISTVFKLSLCLSMTQIIVNKYHLEGLIFTLLSCSMALILSIVEKLTFPFKFPKIFSYQPFIILLSSFLLMRLDIGYLSLIWLTAPLSLILFYLLGLKSFSQLSPKSLVNSLDLWLNGLLGVLISFVFTQPLSAELSHWGPIKLNKITEYPYPFALRDFFIAKPLEQVNWFLFLLLSLLISFLITLLYNRLKILGYWTAVIRMSFGISVFLGWLIFIVFNGFQGVIIAIQLAGVSAFLGILLAHKNLRNNFLKLREFQTIIFPALMGVGAFFILAKNTILIFGPIALVISICVGCISKKVIQAKTLTPEQQSLLSFGLFSFLLIWWLVIDFNLFLLALPYNLIALYLGTYFIKKIQKELDYN